MYTSIQNALISELLSFDFSCEPSHRTMLLAPVLWHVAFLKGFFYRRMSQVTSFIYCYHWLIFRGILKLLTYLPKPHLKIACFFLHLNIIIVHYRKFRKYQKHVGKNREKFPSPIILLPRGCLFSVHVYAYIFDCWYFLSNLGLSSIIFNLFPPT